MRTSPRTTLSLVLLLAALAAVYLWPGGSADPESSNVDSNVVVDVTESSDSPTDVGNGVVNPEVSSQGQRVIPSAKAITRQVVDTDGNPLSGEAYLLTVTDEIIHQLETELTLGPRTIFELGDLQELKVVDGELEFTPPADGRGFLWVEIDSHRIQQWHLDLEELPRQLQLESCAPFHVKVLKVDGGPVAHVSVEMQAHGSDDAYSTSSWRYRLQRRTIEIYRDTNAEGIATFESIPDHAVHVRVSGEPGLGTLAEDLVDPVGTLELHATNSCRVLATVRDQEGKPIEGVFMVAFRQDETGQRDNSGAKASGEDGVIDIEQVSCTGEDLSMAFYMNGYEMVVEPLRAPRPGKTYEFDIKLEPAIAMSMKLVGVDGKPLADMTVDFEVSSHAWVPITHTTSSEGTFTTQALHKPGAAYWMKIYSAGGKLRTMRITAPDAADEVITVQVDGIGALRKRAGQGIDDVEYSFVSFTDPEEQTFQWKDREVTPWLPSGPGVLQTLKDGQAVSAEEVIIPSGVGDWPEVSNRAEHVIRFQVNSSANEQIQAFAVGRGSIDVLLADVDDQPQNLELPFLPASVELRSSQRGTMSLGTFGAAEVPVDLGVVSWSADCTIQGTIQTDDHFALRNCLVSLLGASGQVLRTMRSDEAGSFSFTRLTSGAYWVRVEPSNGSASWHPTSEHAVRFTGPSQSQQLDVRYPESASMVVELSAGEWRRPMAWMLGDGKLYRSGFDRDWKAIMPQAERAAMVWVVDGETGSNGDLILRAIHSQLSSEQNRVELSTAALPQTTVTLETADSGQIRVIGPRHQLLASYPIHQGAQIQLTATSSCPLYLQFRNATQVGRIEAMDSVLSTKTLDVVGAWQSHTIQVFDLNQQPIANGTILAVSGHRHWLANDRGQAKVPGDYCGEEIEVHHPDYFPVRLSLEQRSAGTTTATLRALSGPIEIRSTELAPTVQLIPQFSTHFSLPKLTESSPSKWTTRGYPEGSYSLVRRTAAGEEAKRSTVVIHPGASTSFSIHD